MAVKPTKLANLLSTDGEEEEVKGDFLRFWLEPLCKW